MPALRRWRRHAGERRSAKGGTRTPKAFRLPDPKSGASASSATFAKYYGEGIRGARGREAQEGQEGLSCPSHFTLRPPPDPQGSGEDGGGGAVERQGGS